MEAISKSGYTYRPLNPGEIRVLYFEPDSHLTPGSKVRCHLQHVPLKNAPDYIAISYAWGYKPQDQDMILDGQLVKFPVTSEQALRGLFSRSSASPLRDLNTPVWIDSICINQENKKEKSTQVEMMMEIYSSARNVLVWLGPDSETTASAIHSINVMYDECYRITNGFQGLIRLSNINDENSVPSTLPPSCSVFALLKFYTAKWFTRIWIIQEVIVAKEAFVIQGTHSIEWLRVAVVGRWMVGRLRAIPTLMDAATWTIFVGAGGVGVRNAGITWDIKTDVNGKGHKPRFLFNDACFFESTDPRDKVWALYGLLKLFRVPDRQLQLIKPGYETKTIAQVYAAATFVVFLNDSTLNYLEAATPWQALRPSQDAEEGACPSWASKFEKMHIEKVNIEGNKSPRSMDFHHNLIHGVCAGIQIKQVSIKCQLNSPPYVLTVKGIICSTVTSVGNPIDKITVELALKNGDFPTLARELLNSWRPPSLDPLLRTLTQSGPREDFGIASVYGLAGFWHNIRHIGDPGQRNREFMQDYAAFLIRLMDSINYVDPSLRQQLQSYRPENGKVETYLLAMAAWASNKVLFTTNGQVGDLGTGPVGMKPGDRVCFVYGSKMPFIIRWQGPFWTLVGQCYVCGVMGGSLVQRLRQQGKLDKALQDIHII